jgi:hypothetical protein
MAERTKRDDRPGVLLLLPQQRNQLARLQLRGADVMARTVRRQAGRDELNFSNWAESREDIDYAIESIADGEMPPRRYTLIHRNATLTTEEADTLISALLQMGGDPEHDRGPGDDDEPRDSSDD